MLVWRDVEGLFCLVFLKPPAGGDNSESELVFLLFLGISDSPRK